MIVFLIVIVGIISVILNYIRSKKFPQDTVICLTGGLGTGKTLIAVDRAIKEYRKRLFMWRLGIYNKRKGFKVVKRAEMPKLYSNIPILLKRPVYISKKVIPYREYFSEVLTYEHILLLDRIPEYSVVLIDEVGQVADQYQYDNPFIMQNLQKFIRYFRHFIDGRLILTDQSSSNIVVAIRRRINKIYNLHDFRRNWFFFYKVKVQELFITEDIMATSEQNIHKEYEYFYGVLPLKWLRFLDITRLWTYKKYDSRCYSIMYDDVKQKLNERQHEDYKTDYVIDIPNNNEMRKEFKAKGFIPADKMQEYIKQYLSSK